jgi:galactonate dehydratase
METLSRRRFLERAGAGSLALACLGSLPRAAQAAAEAVRPLKIVKVEAVRFRRDLRIQGISPNWTWVRLHTDSGLVGTGESCPTHDAHMGALEEIAGMVLGREATAIERL